VADDDGIPGNVVAALDLRLCMCTITIIRKLFIPVSVRSVARSAFANSPADIRGFMFKGNQVYDEKGERIVGYSGRGQSVVNIGHSCCL
jgi:hypothetical protein